jgi:MFS family permease
MDRIGERPMLIAGPALTGVGFAALTWVARDGGYASSVLPVMAVIGLGMGVTVAPLSATVLNAVPSRQAGVASGVNNALSRAAGLVGVPVFGLIGQAGFTASLGGGTFSEPGTVAAGYAEGMRAALVWIALAGGAMALLSAALAAAALPRKRPAG